jgi:membrane-bound serine protease (ClpP class)
MFGSLLFAMVDLYPDRPLDISVDGLLQPVINLGIAVLLSAFVMALIARFLPHLPMFRRLILAETSPAGPSFDITGTGFSLPAVGETGVARSILRPAGKADFSGKLVDVVTDGEFLESGSAVRVVRVAGERVVVAQV